MAEETPVENEKPAKKIAVKRKVKAAAKKKKPESVSMTVKRDINSEDKIFLGVSKRLSKLTGVDVNIIRVLFFLSAVLIIGIPIYFLLSLFMKD